MFHRKWAVVLPFAVPQSALLGISLDAACRTGRHSAYTPALHSFLQWHSPQSIARRGMARQCHDGWGGI